jgi:hypothetical protein
MGHVSLFLGKVRNPRRHACIGEKSYFTLLVKNAFFSGQKKKLSDITTLAVSSL